MKQFSYNDIIKISTLFSEKNTQAINYVNSLLPSKNIIDFLSKIKKSRFNKNSFIKLQEDGKELIVYKKSFLTNLPEDKNETITIDGYDITIGYPRVGEYSKERFIKKIKKGNVVVKINKNNYKDIPINLYNKCRPTIEKFAKNLNKIFVYYINDKYKSGFFLYKEVINYVIYLCYVYDVDSLLEQQLHLMMSCKFAYSDFDTISYEQFNKYTELYSKILKRNERAAK